MENYNLDQFVKDVEKSLLFTILAYMKHGRLTSKDSQRLAQEFLKLLPPEDKEQFLQEFFDLGRIHTQVLYVYHKYGDPYEEEKRVKKLLLIREYFEQGDYETAAKIAKGGLPLRSLFTNAVVPNNIYNEPETISLKPHETKGGDTNG